MLRRRLPIHSAWRKPPTLTKTMVQRTPHCQEIKASHVALCNSASEGILLFSHRLCPITYRSPIALQYVGYTRLSSSELVDLDLIASRGCVYCHSECSEESRKLPHSRKALNKGLPNCFSDYQELQEAAGRVFLACSRASRAGILLLCSRCRLAYRAFAPTAPWISRPRRVGPSSDWIVLAIWLCVPCSWPDHGSVPWRN